MTSTFNAPRALKSGVAIAALAALPLTSLVALPLQAQASDGSPLTTSVVEGGDVVSRDSIPTRPNFKGLVCVPGRDSQTLSFAAEMNLAGFWAKWSEVYEKNKQAQGVGEQPLEAQFSVNFTVPNGVTIHRGELTQERLQLAFAAASPAAAKLFVVDGNGIVANGNRVVVQFALKDKALKAPAFDAFKDTVPSLKAVFPDGSLTVSGAATRSDEPLVLGPTTATAQLVVNPNKLNGGPSFGALDAGNAPAGTAVDRYSDATLAHTFTSATPGKNLPREVLSKTPDKVKFANEAAITLPADPAEKTVKVADGEWIFQSWDAKKDTGDGCAHFSTVGKWAFTAAPKQDGDQGKDKDQGQGQDQGKDKDQGQGGDQGKDKDQGNDKGQGKPKPQPQPQDKDKGQSSAKPQAKDANKSAQKAPSTKGGLAKTGFESGLLAAAGLILAAGASLTIVRRRNS